MTRFRRSLGNWVVLFREDDRAFAVLIGLVRLRAPLGVRPRSERRGPRPPLPGGPGQRGV